MSFLKKIYHGLRHTLGGLWLNGPNRNAVQIAITGSFGKTSITQAVYRAISAQYPTVRTDENLDTIYNVPITALSVRPSDRFVIFELGIDSPGEMDFHLRIVRPKISIISGITPVHSDAKHVGSLEDIIRQKGRIIDVLGPGDLAILNGDDPFVREMANRTKAEVIFYGSGPDNSYTVSNIALSLSGTRFTLTTPGESIEIETRLLGAHNAMNLAAAAACAHRVGVTNETLQRVFKTLVPLEGRFSIEPGPNNLILINDTLRANPESTKAGLRFLSSLPTQNRTIAVLGEMGELGNHELSEHRAVGLTAAQTAPDLLITVGDLTKHTAAAALENGLPSDRIRPARNVHEAAHILQEEGRSGDIVYLKGSLMRHMERIPMLLAGEEVVCATISCPFYHHCSVCGFLKTGYNPAE